MALSARLQLRQSQSLVMTPQLMQSIRLLQLTHLELERFIDEEIERNPLLERADDAAEPAALPNDADQHQGGDDDWSADHAEWTSEAMSERLDTSLENVFPDDPGRQDRLGPDLTAQWKSASGNGGSSQGGGEGYDIDAMAAAPTSLGDLLAEQIAFSFVDPTDRQIAALLADAVDEAGYLDTDTAELAERLGVEAPDIERVLATCQTFEPAGVFARDLAECLSLQLKARDRLDPAMQALLAHLELLAKRDFVALSKICGVERDDLVDMLAEIRLLDPKPGLAYSTGPSDPIVPDVTVSTGPDGGWAVELNADTLPKVLVDNAYYAEVSGVAKDSKDREFLAGCLQSANWLTRSLDQRARTILKVATEIVRQQDAFLVNGIRHLKPLNLKMVADAIGMHESTVSRVTANKYMLTPRGVFELRYFFTAAIASAEGGEAHSAESVRDRIRELIDAEKPVDVLSDDAIVDILRKNGVDIARRTVAKYREGMSIPSSVQRRREKRALAGLAS
ncbi:MAG: RNA polymerase factor sigma-54 [Rhizobiaceae bacterium]|nr:RNA polymerase factor sigma-54 [Rhizobiaceae bacterium]